MKFFSLCVLLSVAPMIGARDECPSSQQGQEAYQDESSLSNPATRDILSEELSSPDRFQEIKMEDALEEVTFWAHQLSEHGLFLHLGIEDAPLKKRGLQLHKKFENFRKNMNKENLSEVLPLAQELRAYKIDIVKALDEGKWIGWIYPSFAEHVTRELDYFVDKLNNVSFSGEQELDFWNLINADHAGFTAHLVDPTERKVARRAALLSQKIRMLPKSEEEMFVILSLRAAEQLDAFHKKGKSLSKENKLKSVIHPALLDHVIREGERSIENIERVKRSMEAEEGMETEDGNQEVVVEETE